MQQQFPQQFQQNYQQVQTGLPSGVDLSQLLSSAAFNNATVPQQQSVISSTTKAKKKTPTAQEKREKMCLNILGGKDPYGLDHSKLLLQMTAQELSTFMNCVKAKHNLP